MPANLHNPRPDIVYLRRRLKPGETAPAKNTVTTSAPSLRLDLNRDRGTETQNSAAVTPLTEDKLEAVSIPTAKGISLLKKVNDAYRLDRRQSAIGSLVIGNAMVAGWQMQDGSSGYLYSQGVSPTESPETHPRQFKNRQLVEFRKELLVVGLRNFKQLKRLIVVPKPNETLQAETLGGAGVLMDYEPFTVLYISVVDSVIEFRKEDFRKSVTDTYNLHTVRPQNSHRDTIKLGTLFS